MTKQIKTNNELNDIVSLLENKWVSKYRVSAQYRKGKEITKIKIARVK